MVGKQLIRRLLLRAPLVVTGLLLGGTAVAAGYPERPIRLVVPYTAGGITDVLARALAVEAELLLMDEPLANLDPPHQGDWMQTVRALVAEGRTVVSVLHELNVALAADAMVVMAGGRVTHHGACGDAATHQALEAVFDHRVALHHVAGQWLAVPH